MQKQLKNGETNIFAVSVFTHVVSGEVRKIKEYEVANPLLPYMFIFQMTEKLKQNILSARNQSSNEPLLVCRVKGLYHRYNGNYTDKLTVRVKQNGSSYTSQSELDSFVYETPNPKYNSIDVSCSVSSCFFDIFVTQNGFFIREPKSCRIRFYSGEIGEKNSLIIPFSDL